MRRLKSERPGARQRRNVGRGESSGSGGSRGERRQLQDLLALVVPEVPAAYASALPSHPSPAGIVFEPVNRHEKAALHDAFGLTAGDGLVLFLPPSDVQAFLMGMRPDAGRIARHLDDLPPPGFAWLIVMTSTGMVHAALVSIDQATSAHRGQA